VLGGEERPRAQFRAGLIHVLVRADVRRMADGYVQYSRTVQYSTRYSTVPAGDE
jgi:hypothetical protein